MWNDDARLRRLACLGLAMLVLTLAALACTCREATPSIRPRTGSAFVDVDRPGGVCVQFAAVATVLRGVPPRAVWLVIAVAAALRIGPLLAPPFLSSDVYRYVWDGRVQAAGINPYFVCSGRSGAGRAAG